MPGPEKTSSRPHVFESGPTQAESLQAEGGSFIIGGPGSKVSDSHMRDSYSDHPGSFGGIVGDEVDSSTMEGNVHEPGAKGPSGRPAIDIGGDDASIERVEIEDCSVEYTDDPTDGKRQDQ